MKYGDITVDMGEAKNRSFGLRHIIKQRHDKGKSIQEIAALLILLDGTLKGGEKKRDIKFGRQPSHLGRMELESGGIVAVVSKQRNQGDKEQWVLTGFEDKENKEAADTIQKVISRYGYTPEFLVLEKQVGAVVSSLNKVSPETGEKSRVETEKTNEDGHRFSLEDLNEGWPKGIFTMQEAVDSLRDGDAFQGFSVETWREANKNEEEYRAGQITGKELGARQEKLFSEENKVESGAIRKAIKMEKTRVTLIKTLFGRDIAKAIVDQKKLKYFKQQILSVLQGDDTVDIEGEEGVKKAGYPVGTIRTWKGKEFVKVAPGKWRPKYSGDSRGAKMAIAAIKKKVDAAKTAQELMNIVLEHRDRFSDINGNPLPIVQELSKYVAEKEERLAGEQSPSIKGEPQEETGQNKGKVSGETMRNPVNGTGTQEGKGLPAEEQAEIAKKLEELAVPMDKIEYTRENYNRLFPMGSTETPVGTVKMGESQFEKLDAKNRRELLGAVSQTLKDPVVVLGESGGGKDAKLFIKTFKSPDSEKTDYVQSVVVEIEGENVSISTGLRRPGQIDAKIKMAGILHYLKGKEGGGPTHEAEEGNPLAARQDRILPETSEKSSPKPEKNEKLGDTDSQDDVDFQSMRNKYQGGKNIEGNEDEIYVGDEAMKGKWKLVEADSPSASHNEETFGKTRGFPKNKDGSTINDRDYQRDRAAQETVISMASNFDGRALSFDSPVVVTQDGVVVSGNNRTMSSKLAARRGSDTKYVDALRKRAERFGFKALDVDGFRNPRVVFEIEGSGEYSTRDFAKYNQESQKTMSPIESAVKVSKIITEGTIKDVAGHIAEFETMGELYADKKACMAIFNSLQTGKIINEFSRNTYVDPDGIVTGAGKEFLETVLIGSVVNEQNIRALNREGCKHIRAKLVRAITPLINNKSLGGYSIMEELNEAIDINIQYNIGKDKFSSLDDLVNQGNMFEQMSSAAVELARKMQMTQKDFAEFMQKMNASLEIGASGQSDIFLGEVESKDDVLSRILSIKKAVRNVAEFFRKGGVKTIKESMIKAFSDDNI